MRASGLLTGRKSIRYLSFCQEAWGNRSQNVLEIPDGYTPEAYAAALQLCHPYSYPRFYVQVVDGALCVVEENYESIGD